MPFLTIRHVTTYRYLRPVAFGEHRMMLHPRDSHDQRVIQADLKISPEPTSLSLVQDAFGNSVGIARFSGRSKELSFESIVCLEHSPCDLEDAGWALRAAQFPVCAYLGRRTSKRSRHPPRRLCQARRALPRPVADNRLGATRHPLDVRVPRPLMEHRE
jgi:hypothetical protein